MRFPRIKYAYRYLLLTLKRIKIYAQPPWGHQCRKFDVYFVRYAAPVSTVSFGLTIPFLFCLYISLGTKCRWWGTVQKPKFLTATFGFWFFLGSRLCSWSIKTCKGTIDGEINFQNMR